MGLFASHVGYGSSGLAASQGKKDGAKPTKYSVKQSKPVDSRLPKQKYRELAISS